MTEKRIKALEDEIRGLHYKVEKLEKALAARVAALERAFVPTEGDLTWEKVIQGILRNDHGPIEEWKRRGYPIPGMKE